MPGVSIVPNSGSHALCSMALSEVFSFNITEIEDSYAIVNDMHGKYIVRVAGGFDSR